MLIQLDYMDGRPIYEQITESIKRLILMDALAPDEKLQSVRSIYTVPGRGNFVADSAGLKEERKQELRGKLQGILREAAEMGIPREELLQDL